MSFTCETIKVDTKPLSESSGSCFEFWIYRYQTLIGAFVAIGAAVIAWVAVEKQVNAANRQIEVANKQLSVSRISILSEKILGMMRVRFLIDQIYELISQIDQAARDIYGDLNVQFQHIAGQPRAKDFRKVRFVLKNLIIYEKCKTKIDPLIDETIKFVLLSQLNEHEQSRFFTIIQEIIEYKKRVYDYSEHAFYVARQVQLEKFQAAAGRWPRAAEKYKQKSRVDIPKINYDFIEVQRRNIRKEIDTIIEYMR